ncbi:hypothetical protein M422DRAFT_54195 [Sphaerobolus stellatus SS14]|uniref:serine--tRNA ligase n=1 Tax=Sphaerobolus stellatus (strain SS14) TaxID=990650 RepID=A0A0C9TII0_SPHS4|nr:hypothetical protein M422DRAFT_54195 [Sphaerobolus stellatus SS14]
MKFASPTLPTSPRCIYLLSRARRRRYAHKDAIKDIRSSTNLPLPRLDYKGISDNLLYKSHNAFNRKTTIPAGAVQSAARLYDDLKAFNHELTQKQHQQNSATAVVKTSKDAQAKAIAIETAKSLKIPIAELKAKASDTESELLSIALLIPNDTHPDTPLGPEEAAIVLETHGPEPCSVSLLRDHVRIARTLDILDLDAAATVTGSSWYYLLNEGAILETALINYALSVSMKYGYRPVITPDVIKADIAARCGFQPRDTADVQQMYYLASDPSKDHPELVLAGTAEIPLGGLFANKVYDESELPMKVVGVGKAFRAEAGARGADTRGLYRVHQFSKVELFTVTAETQSENMMEELRKIQVEILEGLNLPFRVLDMPTEELGASAYRKYDMEAWMPGRGRWGEVSSASNCTDYQSRRLHMRYRRKTTSSGEEKQGLPFAHTLNGTAAAIPRLIVALLENGVRLEGEEVVGLNLPKVLKPFWIAPSDLGKCKIQWI